MEEIFANSGYQHIAEIICKNLEPDSFQKLVLTCKTIQKFSAVISDRWLKKCQEKGLCLTISWTLFIQVLDIHFIHWNLGIILHKINHDYNPYVSKSKFQPLVMAAKCGQVKIVKLLSAGNINENYFAYKDILETLMGNLEKVQTFKAFSKVLEIFLIHNTRLIKDLLETADKKGSTEIKEILKLLLNEPDYLGHTPMHTYAYHGNMKQAIEIVKFVAPICLFPNHQDNFGTTPMHIAAEFGHVEFVKALIPKWKNQQAKNHKNKTAFQIAKEKGFQEIMDLMIQISCINGRLRRPSI